MPRSLDIDVVIFGGGAAGLWTLDVLSRQGYRCVLIEKTALGTGQTVGSQGIIHGGLKYSLDGLLTQSAYQIRQMPGIWRDCLNGSSEPNLSDVALRSDGCYLWRTDSLSSRLGMLGAQIGLQVTPQSISKEARPSILKDVPGHVAIMPEQVISPTSFIHSLGMRWADRLMHVPNDDVIKFDKDSTGRVTSIRITQSTGEYELRCHQVIFSAGQGNATLREAVGLSADRMQRRPLHMTIAKGNLPVFNGHCVDGSKTRVTITSEVTSDGDVAWQIGGQVAELGVSMMPEQLIQLTTSELKAVIPGFDPSCAQWSTYRVDRAEGLTPQGKRPDQPVMHLDHNVITVWPTKLAFAPSVASQLQSHLSAHVPIRPGFTLSDLELMKSFDKPKVAPAVWESATQWWSIQPNQQPVSVRRVA